MFILNKLEQDRTLIPRLQHILDLLELHGECGVEFLSRACQVSDMTIRRDLQKLADDGRVVRTHGGAARAEQVMFEFQFLQRAKSQQEEKNQIGLAASRLVKEGQSILLDSGTTTLALARHLRKHNRLTVITTSLPIAASLQQAPGVETLLLGGYVRHDSPDLVGALTESNLETLRADVAFVGADGVDLNGNVYNNSLNVARMLAKMAASAREVYVLADHTKLGRTALKQFGNVNKWNGLITDESAASNHLSALRDAGVNVMQYEENSGTAEAPTSAEFAEKK
jgi:DeoR/GlpR family transcriptional regulator of sugar metabolism